MTKADWLSSRDREDWLSSSDPQGMLRWLGYPARIIDRRKLSLFSAACCRRHWDLLSERGRSVVERMERSADGIADERAETALKEGKGPFCPATSYRERAFFVGAAVTALLSDYHPSPLQNALAVSSWAASEGPIRAEEQAAQADILRDLFGVSFFPEMEKATAIERRWIDWNDGTVRRLARAIYDERAFERLPILADALEEAGCTKAWILKHARESGVHVRGCWLVDLLRSAV
jgi:hypothetical protein